MSTIAHGQTMHPPPQIRFATLEDYAAFRKLFLELGIDDPIPPEYRHWAFPQHAADPGDAHTAWRRERVAWSTTSGREGRDTGGIDVGIPESLDRSPYRDWSCRDLQKTFTRLTADGRVRFHSYTAGRQTAVSRLFLRAVWKGGLQGALYVLDSLLPRRDRDSDRLSLSRR